MTTLVEAVPEIMRILSHMQQHGVLASTACDELGLSYSMFDTYTNKIDRLAKLRKEAEDRVYDMLAEALINPDDHWKHGRSDPKMAAIVSKNIQWLLARRKQDKYGDKVISEHVITADREVIAALQAAKARAHGVEALPAPSSVAREAGSAVIEGVAEVLVEDAASGALRVETEDERIVREMAELL